MWRMIPSDYFFVDAHYLFSRNRWMLFLFSKHQLYVSIFFGQNDLYVTFHRLGVELEVFSLFCVNVFPLLIGKPFYYRTFCYFFFSSVQYLWKEEGGYPFLSNGGFFTFGSATSDAILFCSFSSMDIIW